MIDSININCIKAIKANFRWKLIVNGTFLKQGSFEKLITLVWVNNVYPPMTPDRWQGIKNNPHDGGNRCVGRNHTGCWDAERVSAHPISATRLATTAGKNLGVLNPAVPVSNHQGKAGSGRKGEVRDLTRGLCADKVLPCLELHLWGF